MDIPTTAMLSTKTIEAKKMIRKHAQAKKFPMANPWANMVDANSGSALAKVLVDKHLQEIEKAVEAAMGNISSTSGRVEEAEDEYADEEETDEGKPAKKRMKLPTPHPLADMVDASIASPFIHEFEKLENKLVNAIKQATPPFFSGREAVEAERPKKVTNRLVQRKNTFMREHIKHVPKIAK